MPETHSLNLIFNNVNSKVIDLFSFSGHLPSLLYPEPCLMSLVNTMRRTTRLPASLMFPAFRVISAAPRVRLAFLILSYKPGDVCGGSDVRGAGARGPRRRRWPPSPPRLPALAPTNGVSLKRQDAKVFLVETWL